MKKRGQASMEFMLIVGFMMSILIPLTILYYQQLNFMVVSVKGVQLNKVANEIVNKAQEAYYLGPPTKITIKVYIPSGVENISIYNNEINFKLKIGSGANDIFAVSTINITGSISNYAGIHSIVIKAEDNYVKILG